MKTPRFYLYSVLIVVCIIWGGAFPAIKYLLSFLSPLQLVKFRYIIAVPFFVVILFIKDKITIREIITRYPLALLIASLFGVIGYNLALAYGETEIPSGIASLIINLSPIFTLILSLMFLKERITISMILGMAISFSGLFILVRRGASDNGANTNYYLYALITALAPLSWAIYTIASKKLTERFDAFTITGLTIIIGTLPLFFTLGSKDFTAAKSMNATAWIVLLYLSIASTSLGYTVWVIALRALPSGKVASFVYTIPVFSVIIGRIFLGELITIHIIFGAALLLIGVYVVNRAKTKKKSGNSE
ncbi:DMT family transporter [Candidatus Sumerlaeota bacterium]|nr:DMT family transporter [Candidatus Sumerlaeota bacterium]